MRDSELLLQQFALTATKARCIGLMSVSVAGLRPTPPTVSARIGSFIQVESEVVFQTADLREEFAAAMGLTSPDLVHSVRHIVPHVGDNEVLGLLGIELLLVVELLDGLAPVVDAWHRP